MMTYSIMGNNFNNKYEIITSNNAKEMGFIGADYDTEYTNIRTYTSKTGIRSINYSGKRKNGEVMIRFYDSKGILLEESKAIKEKEFNEVFVCSNGVATKVEIEYIDFNSGLTLGHDYLNGEFYTVNSNIKVDRVICASKNIDWVLLSDNTIITYDENNQSYYIESGNFLENV